MSKESESTFFRVEKTRDFTVISNHHLKNKSLSLRAKGLLTLMLSLPEDWDFSLSGLEKLSSEKMTALRTALGELESAGYVKHSRYRNERGQLKGTEYFIYEQPQLRDAHISDEPTLEKPILEKPIQGKPTLGNRTQLNTNKSKTKELNTDCIKYPPINNGTPDGGAGWIDRYNKINSEVKEQIEYDALIHSNNAELINDIVGVMTEVLLVDTPYYTIEGKQIPTELVRINYRKITYNRLEVFLLDFTRLYDEIKNPKKYLITALYNIASTAETSITNRVNRDLYGG